MIKFFSALTAVLFLAAPVQAQYATGSVTVECYPPEALESLMKSDRAVEIYESYASEADSYFYTVISKDGRIAHYKIFEAQENVPKLACNMRAGQIINHINKSDQGT